MGRRRIKDVFDTGGWTVTCNYELGVDYVNTYIEEVIAKGKKIETTFAMYKDKVIYDLSGNMISYSTSVVF